MTPQGFQQTYSDTAYRTDEQPRRAPPPPDKPMNVGQHVLYFSNHCEYSRSICEKIFKNGLKDHFMGVCVDDTRGEIPSFVKCVPTILTIDRRMLVDDDVMRFVSMMAAPKEKEKEKEKDDDLLGFTGTPGFSDSFAVLDTCAEFTSDDHHSFGAIAIDDQPPPPSMMEESSGKPPRLDAKEIDMYMSRRDEDTQFAKQKQAGARP